MKIAFKILTFALVLLAFTDAQAQKPVINSLSKTSGQVNNEISIAGSGFGTNLSNVSVYFGAVKGSVSSVSANLIKAKVPAGTTYGSVSVTNHASGLTGYSSGQFGLSFGGDGFAAANLAAQPGIAAGAGLFDLCLCDFDGDDKSDVATSNEVATDIGIYKNNSNASGSGPISLSGRQSLSLGVATPTKNINCGDIDGDGKPDLVVSGDGSYGQTIFILKNMSPTPGIILFDPPIMKTVGSNGAARIAIRDLNGDGKPDLVVTNRSSNQISIFPNTSTVGNISFGAVRNITVTGAAHTNGLATEDLDNDGLPEIIVNTSQQHNIYILKNQSTTASIAFQTAPISLVAPSGSVNLAVGDLDNDGKPDIAVTNVLNAKVYLYRNTTNTTISFADIVETPVDITPWGITLGDADGDGLTDIIVGFSQSKFINVLENKSTAGAFSFTKHSIATTEKTRNVKIGDLNGDGKPDFAFTSTETFQLSVMRNKHCLEAKITPAGPLAVCSDTEVKLSATSGLGVSYQWSKGGVAIPGATASTYIPTENGNYTVSVTSTTDGCAKTSNAVSLTIDQSEMGDISVANASVCAGETITLTATPGGTKYHWSGPNGYSAVTTSNTTTIPNATTSNQGAYSLVMELGTCTSLPIPFNVSVKPLPNPIINALSGSLSFCVGGSVELSAGSAFADYKWKKNGAVVATTPTYTATEGGNYSVIVTSANGCTKESAAVAVSENAPPVASFLAMAVSCVGQEITFENTSQANAGATYLWDFGDGNTSTDKTPYHAYTGVNDAYVVTLEVSYGGKCPSTTSKTIKIAEEPVLEITAEGSTSICDGDSVKLSVPAIFKNYVWTAGSQGSFTTPSIYATKDGVVTVAVTTEEGCTVNASIEINMLGSPDISVSADKMVLKPGESTVLNASGGVSYTWFEADGISDLELSNPTVSPIRTTTYRVTGTNEIGCSSTAEITIEVDNELSVSPPKLFVPGSDPAWQIEGMEYYEECNVIIFNKQGLKLFEQKDYHYNPWDGTYNGQPVAEGVYYYVIRCEGTTNEKTGAITLMR